MWMYLWWREWTLYSLTYQVRVTVGDLGLSCCVCVTSFKHWLTPLCADSAQTLWRLVLFQILVHSGASVGSGGKYWKPQIKATPCVRWSSHGGIIWWCRKLKREDVSFSDFLAWKRRRMGMGACSCMRVCNLNSWTCCIRYTGVRRKYQYYTSMAFHTTMHLSWRVGGVFCGCGDSYSLYTSFQSSHIPRACIVQGTWNLCTYRHHL